MCSHLADEKQYVCKVCDSSFSKMIDLLSHELAHVLANELHSTVCESTSTGTHERTRTESYPFECNVCGKGFKRCNGLNTHTRTHTGDAESKTKSRPYECDVCWRAFTTSSNLTRHMRIHTGERPYQCHTCGRLYSDSSSLVIHERTHISCEHECNVCGRCFSTSSSLMSHKRAHTKPKPLACDVCGRSFVRSSNLAVHTARTHAHK